MAGVLSQNLLRYPSQARPDEVPPVLDTLASPLERTPHCRYHRCPASALAPLLLESESESGLALDAASVLVSDEA